VAASIAPNARKTNQRIHCLSSCGALDGVFRRHRAQL
jgi:hypothetical protein